MEWCDMNSLIINCETGEETTEPLSAERIAYLEAEAQKTKEAEDKAAAKRAAAEGKLAALGLTSDDLRALNL